MPVEEFLSWQFAEAYEAANTDLGCIPDLFYQRIRLSEPAGESEAVPASTIADSATRILGLR